MSDTLERLRELERDHSPEGKGKRDFYAGENLGALLDIAEAAPCRRFTMIPCRERPEIPPEHYCTVCKGFAALDSTGGAER